MDTIEIKTTAENATPPLSTILLCPECSTPWSADYEDYCWMRDRDVLVCACGEVLCEVRELRGE